MFNAKDDNICHNFPKVSTTPSETQPYIYIEIKANDSQCFLVSVYSFKGRKFNTKIKSLIQNWAPLQFIYHKICENIRTTMDAASKKDYT